MPPMRRETILPSEEPGAYQRVYFLRTPDVGDGGDDHAPDQVAADNVVLGRPLDGDAF